MRRKIVVLNLIVFILFFKCVPSASNESVIIDSSSRDAHEGVGDFDNLDGSTLFDVEGIQKTYAQTTKWLAMGSLDSSDFAYNCQQEKRGRVRYFTKNDKLILIEHVYSEYDHYEAVDRYYIHNDSLYFVLLKGTAWSFVSEAEGVTRDDITERRIYLLHGELLSCLEKKYSEQSDAKKKKDSERIANKKVACLDAAKIWKPFEQLLRHYKRPTANCLE